MGAGQLIQSRPQNQTECKAIYQLGLLVGTGPVIRADRSDQVSPWPPPRSARAGRAGTDRLAQSAGTGRVLVTVG